jgi:hypothetical protein
MINRVATASRCPPLQACELPDQPLMIRQPHTAR